MHVACKLANTVELEFDWLAEINETANLAGRQGKAISGKTAVFRELQKRVWTRQGNR